MATQPFESGQQFPLPSSESSNFEHKPQSLELVYVPTIVEMKDILDAGATFACYQRTSEVLDDSGLLPTSQKVKTTYLAASPQNIDKMVGSGDFGDDWQRDDAICLPYSCLVKETVPSSPDYSMVPALIHSNLQTIFEGKDLEIESDSDAYLFEKKKKEFEKREGGNIPHV